MSSYIMFAVKKKDTAIELCYFSRSSDIYQTGEHCTEYGYWAPLGVSECLDIITDCKEDIERMTKHIQEDRQQIADIGQFNNSMEEKMETIEELRQDISGYEELIDEKRQTLGWYYSLYLMADSLRYIDKEAELYIGIEASLRELTGEETEEDND